MTAVGWSNPIVKDLLTVALGVVAGAMSGAFSMGGGTLQKPGIRLLGGTAFEAIGTTVPVLIPTTLSAAHRYTRAGLVNFPVARWVVPAGLVGTVLGAVSSRLVPGEGHLLQVATALLLGYAAVRMIVPARPGVAEAAVDPGTGPSLRGGTRPGRTTGTAASGPRLVILGIVAGASGGLLGIGGGVVLVPALHRIARLPSKNAIATSILAVGFFAVPNTITHGLLGNIHWRLALLLAMGVVPGAWLGANVVVKAKNRTVTRATGLVLLLVAGLYGATEILTLITL